MSNQKLSRAIGYMMGTRQFRDEEQALDVLKASLKALRDRLPKVEAFHLGTMLPHALRFTFFEGWHNGQRQAESINKSEFLAEVALHLKGDDDQSLGDLVPVAMKSILNMITEEEAQHVTEAIPRSMRDIFNDRQFMD